MQQTILLESKDFIGVIKVLDPGWFTEEDLINMGSPCVGKNVRVSKNNTIVGLDRISFGSNVRIDDYCTIVTSKEPICIGSFTHIASHVHISGTYGVFLEDFTFIAAGSKIYSGTDNYTGANLINPTVPREYLDTITGKVIFKKYSGVGANCVIMPGVTLEEGAVLGANAFTAKSLDPWSVYVGMPAKFLKKRKKLSEEILKGIVC